MRIFFFLLFAVTLVPSPVRGTETIVVGSKRFNESYILAEMMCIVLEGRGYEVQRRFGLGGTLICFEAIKNGEIDVYPEYTGTLGQAILKSERRLSLDELRARLSDRESLELLEPFGFNNTYAIAVTGPTAERFALSRISDLAGHDEFRFALTHEFLNREDGWPGLSAAYGLKVTPVGIEHGLAYEALSEGRIDVTDVYSTDGDIAKHGLVLLEDDREYFPRYLAAPLVREGLGREAKSALDELAGRISDERMQQLNAAVLLEGKTFAEVAAAFLTDVGIRASVSERHRFWPRLLRRTLTHLKLTFIALLIGIVVAIPLGIAVYRGGRAGRPVVYVAGVLQTIPSIALLALMIPVFGIGALPAIVALFLYALLPILRNTATALFSIDPVIRKVARGMGMTALQRLRHVELPLAAPTVLAGIKTAAVVNIGTATLAAFIGAGGLGEPIVTGLALGDTKLILEGAIPAALLAVAMELAFELLERALLPGHLGRA